MWVKMGRCTNRLYARFLCHIHLFERHIYLIARDKLSEQQKEAFEYTDKVSAVVGETPAADPSGIAEVNEAFASAGNSVLYGQLTSKEAAKQFREKADAILERNNAQ